MTIFLLFAAAIVCLGVAGVLAAVDSGLSSVPHQHIAEAAEDGVKGAKAALSILADLPTNINVLTFLRLLFEALSTVFVVLACQAAFTSEVEAVIVAVLVASIAVFVLAGVSPRTIGRRRSVQVTLLSAWFVRLLRRALGPVARILVWMGNVLTPDKVYRDGPFVTEEQLRDLVDRASAIDVIEDEERDMIENVFDLGDTRTHSVMVPRTDLVTVRSETTLDKAMSLFLRSGYSRIPVTGAELDDVRGVLYLKDVARRLHAHPEEAEDPVGEVAREAFFVPDTKIVDDLLREMQLHSRHVAIVVDEYGGTAGLVTIEDIVEEIVGEIDDEYDQNGIEVEELPAGAFRVSTRMQVEDFAEHFDVRIDEDEVTTVGGLMSKLLGRVPIAGASIRIEDLVLEAEPGEGRRHRITHVLVRPTHTTKAGR